MPIASEDLKYIAKLTLSKQLSKTPVDQLRRDHPFLGALLRDRQNFLGGKSLSQTVIKDYGSNFTNAKGESPIVFNKRQPTDMAEFDWTRATDSLYLSHDALKTNGITVKEGRRGDYRMTSDEKVQLANMLNDATYVLKEGFLENLDAHLHLNGAQAADCIAGLDALVATDPTKGIVGGFDRSTAKFWRNNAATGVKVENLRRVMEQQWRACIKHGGRPNFIMAGGNFIDAYADAVKLVQNTDAASPDRVDLGLASKSGTDTGCFFKGVPIVYNSTFDRLDEIFPSETIKWVDRCYMLNLDCIKYHDDGFDLVEPTRPYNILALYQMMIVRYSMSLKRANAHSVISIEAASGQSAATGGQGEDTGS
ncbi:phage major capsid protein [Parasutterella secunda]|uniref:Phage major capsid protein n=1 Tax=Parasutterella secunda TaxID=626947 RepID=A0ABS2GRU6_9BURK|nr:phage major capsid protein [Parasutterella secunda]MBM6928176.1 phage major capsid protein [Parasutterella secunda]